MKPNSYPLSSHQTVSFSRQAYPSVPMPVYRQVVEELQATKAQLASVQANNQQLQQEIEQLMQSAHKAQQIINQSNHQFAHKKKTTKVKPIWQAKSWDSSQDQQVVTVKYAPKYTSRQHKKPQEMNGWVLAIAIIAIILTAFTGGFLLVRPLVNHNNNN